VPPSDCSSPELRYSSTLPYNYPESKFYLFYYTVVVAAGTFRLLGLAVTFLRIKSENLLVAYTVASMKAKITILGYCLLSSWKGMPFLLLSDGLRKIHTNILSSHTNLCIIK